MSNRHFVIVLEPTDIRLMKEGHPVSLDLSQCGVRDEVRMYFTPDMNRLMVEMGVGLEKNVLTGDQIHDILIKSLQWREFDRAAN